ncbi:MAG: transposase, partial [Polyangiaceae bacterium]
MAFGGRPGVLIAAPLCVREYDFSLHAATHAGAQDLKGREALLKYILRPPLATERLTAGPDGLVRITLKRAFCDGTFAIDLDPLSLLCRLAATVPPPRFHTVRYSGVLASASKWRSLVVPQRESAGSDAAAASAGCERPEPAPLSSSAGERYRPRAELLKQTFGLDVEKCPSCGGRMRLLALVTEPSSVARFLRHKGEPTEVPPRAA